MTKKFCIKCGKAIQGNADFCPFCGAIQGSIPDTTMIEKSINAKTVQPESPIHQNTVSDKAYNENADPNMVTSTKLFYKDILTIEKRLGRADYWWAFIGNTVLALLVSFFYAFFVSMSPTGGIFVFDKLSGEPTGPTIALFILLGLVTIYYIIVCIAGITAQIRRLHDIGLSGVFWLINFIPVIGNIAILIMLLQPSKQQDNRYI